MKNNRITFCKKGITIVTENADGELYTIIAKHISDLIRDWHGVCNFVPANDAPVHFAAHNGSEVHFTRGCSFESLMRVLEIND